jgi:enoyl-CoA hydratase/carnithine racemase
VIASEAAKFGDQHVNFGLIPGAGNSQRLPRIVGVRRAKEMLLTGEWISAAEAERIGLVNKVVPPDNLEEAVNDMVNKITKNKSSAAAKHLKRLVNDGMQVDLHTGLELEIQTICNYFGFSDPHEGIKAFEGKRIPIFKGV